MTVETKTMTPSLMSLAPPDEVVPVAAAQVTGLVPLADDVRNRVNKQVDAYIQGLLTEDVTSEAFRTKLDAAFALGRREIAEATTQSNSFTKRNFVGETDSAAYTAISEMRAVFDELNPARQGDLFTPVKVLGIKVPFMNKLTNYLRRYQSAEAQINAIYEELKKGQDALTKDIAELALLRQKTWDALLNLEKVVTFVTALDARLSKEIETIRISDPIRAKALEEEVLYYVRQNLEDVLSTQSLTINSYNVMGELRKTGRETVNGCSRVSTMGLAALSVAVTMARATGVQVKMMAMLVQSKQSVNDLIAATGQGLKKHVEETTKFASDPVLGISALQQMFDDTTEAMNTLSNYRTNALSTMKANAELLQKLNQEHLSRIRQERQAASASEVINL